MTPINVLITLLTKPLNPLSNHATIWTIIGSFTKGTTQQEGQKGTTQEPRYNSSLAKHIFLCVLAVEF